MLLVIGTFVTALVSNAFAKPDALQLTRLLERAPTETLEIPAHLGGGFRECYLIRSSFNSVLSKVRRELSPRGWREISVKQAPAHALFTNGTQEVQVLDGKARGAVSMTKAKTRLAARSLAWEPLEDWVSVVFDSPSTHPLDRTKGVLNDLQYSLANSTFLDS